MTLKGQLQCHSDFEVLYAVKVSELGHTKYIRPYVTIKTLIGTLGSPMAPSGLTSCMGSQMEPSSLKLNELENSRSLRI